MSGLTVSVLVHAALASAWLLGQGSVEIDAQQELPLQLAMFMEQAPTEPERTPVLEAKKETEPEARMESQPEPEINPPPEPVVHKAKTVAVVETLPKPHPEREPVPELKPEITPEIKSKPRAKPRAKPSIKPQIQAAKAPAPPPAPKPLPVVEPAFTEAQQLARNTVPESVLPVNSTRVEKGPSTDVLALEEHNYRLWIVQRIESNKFFPKRARKMRQTGDVVVEFTLMRDGSLGQTRILESTAPPILEKAALKSIQISALFPPFPGNIKRNSWSFRTSLEYRLR
jgi:protein TonB